MLWLQIRRTDMINTNKLVAFTIVLVASTIIIILSSTTSIIVLGATAIVYNIQASARSR